MRSFNRGWFVTYSLLGAGLLLGSAGFGQVSDWSAKAIGGTDCNSQDNLTSPKCPKNPDNQTSCTLEYKACNQQAGNGTKICQVEGGTVNSCNSGGCNSRKDDTLTTNDAAGNPCVPKQL